MTVGLRLPGLDEESSVVIFGGGGVLGTEVAVALHEMGVRVGLVGRTRVSLEAAAARMAGRADVALAEGDVSDRTSVERAVAEMVDRIGPITGMVNMASVIGRSQPTAEVSSAELRVLSDINVVGVFESVRATVPAMTAGGSIVLAGSVAAHRARAGNPFYGATKAAMLRLTRQFAHEFGPVGVRVNSISPGQTPTQLTFWDQVGPPAGGEEKGGSTAADKAGRVPLRRRGAAKDYVGPTLFLLSALSAYVTGADLPVDGGLLASF